MKRTVIKIVLTVVALANSFTVTAHNKVVVVPLGGDETPTSKTMFITDELHNGDFGGPAGADEFCQTQADQVGSKARGKRFKAWISGGLAAGMQNNGRTFIRSSVPYETVNGVAIANDFADLLDTSEDLLSRLHYTQFGVAFGASLWTGLYVNGAEHPSNCNGWTSSSFDELGFSGNSNATDFKWTSSHTLECHRIARVICFEQ